MTERQALAAAQKAANRNCVTVYVIYDPDEFGCPEYYPATGEDMDTFFAGCDPIAAVEPEGINIDRILV